MKVGRVSGEAVRCVSGEACEGGACEWWGV